MVKIEFIIATAEDAVRASVISAAIASAFGAVTAQPLQAFAVGVADTAAGSSPNSPAEPRARVTRNSRKAPTDPAAAYEALTGAALDAESPAQTIADEVAAVEIAAEVTPPAETMDEAPPVDVADLLEKVRPLVRLKGVLWGRETLNRYKVKGFSAMTAEQLTTLYAELAPTGTAAAA